MTPSLLAAALEAAPVPLILFDGELRVRQVNAAARRLLGVLQSRRVMSSGSEVLGCVTGHTRLLDCGATPACQVCLIRAAVTECLRTLTEVRERLHFQRSDDQEVFLQITAAPFEHRGEGAALVTLQDVTELAHLQQMLPVCPRCRQVRTDASHWDRVDAYLEDHLASELEASFCERCAGAKKAAR